MKDKSDISKKSYPDIPATRHHQIFERNGGKRLDHYL